MNTEHDFDAKLRQAHAQAIERVSPRTLVQLRPQRAAVRPSSGKPGLRAWPLAATFAIALVAAGLFLRLPLHDEPVVPTAATATTNNSDAADVYAALDESPEFYLWLASNDTYLALE